MRLLELLLRVVCFFLGLPQIKTPFYSVFAIPSIIGAVSVSAAMPTQNPTEKFLILLRPKK